MRFTSGNNKIEELEFCSNIPRYSLSNFDSHSQWFNREYRETHACLMALKSRRTRSTQIHHSIIKVIHITKQNLINIIFEWSFIMTNVLVLSRPRPRPNSTKKKMLTNESTIAQISLHISLPNSVLNLWNIEIQCRHLGNGLNLSFFFADICAVSDFNLMDRLWPQRRTRLVLRSSERNSISLLKENCKSYEMEYFYWL